MPRSPPWPSSPGPRAGGAAELRRLRAEHQAAVRALQGALRDTTRLTRLFAVLGDRSPLPLLLDRALATLSEVFAADVVMFLQRDAAGRFAPLAALGLPEHERHRALPWAEGSRLAEVLRTLAPVVGVAQDRLLRGDALLEDLGVQVEAWIPAVGDGGLAGVLLLARCRPAPFAASDLDLARAMGHRVALALEHRRVEDELRQTQERLHQVERVALAGQLAASVAHEVSSPLACLRSALGAARRTLPALDGQGARGELAELLGEASEASLQIGRLLERFGALLRLEPSAEPEVVDLREVAATSIRLAAAGGAAPLRSFRVTGERCLALVDPTLLRAGLAELLRLLAPGAPREADEAPVAVRAGPLRGRPALVVEDPALALSAEGRRRFFDPHLAEEETPTGRAVRLSVQAAAAHRLLRSCGAEVFTAEADEHGLAVEILLAPPPDGGARPPP